MIIKQPSEWSLSLPGNWNHLQGNGDCFLFISYLLGICKAWVLVSRLVTVPGSRTPPRCKRIKMTWMQLPLRRRVMRKLPIDCSDHVAAHPLGTEGHRSTPAFVWGVGGIKLTGADNSGNPTWPTQGLTKWPTGHSQTLLSKKAEPSVSFKDSSILTWTKILKETIFNHQLKHKWIHQNLEYSLTRYKCPPIYTQRKRMHLSEIMWNCQVPCNCL